MSANTKIEWTDATWNPVLGCSKISPGCKNCYAIRQIHRMAYNPNQKIRQANEGLTIIQNGEPNWTGKIRLIPQRLSIPEGVKKPRRYFVNSLSDLFHENLDDFAIDCVFVAMAVAPWHTFQILTKHSGRMLEYLSFRGRLEQIYTAWTSVSGKPEEVEAWPLPNVHIGVSVESRKYRHRINDLRRAPAAVRFLSLEPLLEHLGELNLDGIHWVIAGGESGPGARPVHPDWMRSIRDQCQATGVPFLFKQWGSMSYPNADGSRRFGPSDGAVNLDGSVVPMRVIGETGAVSFWRVGKKKAGRLLDGREWNEFPAPVKEGVEA